MKLLLFVSIAMFVVAIPSFSQQPVPNLESRALPKPPDTLLNLIHADSLTAHNTPEGQHLIYEGHAEVMIEEYQIKADRIEYDSDTFTLVATGNVVVKIEGEVIRGERFEWKRSAPVAPIINGE